VLNEATARWLTGPDGRGAIALAAAAGPDPLARATAVRRLAPDPERAAAAALQAELADLAAHRYGIDAGPRGLLLTRDGLEQASRPEVAERRARTLADSGARRVVDLAAGLGFDTRAFLAAGLSVTAVEQDPATAVLLAANCPGARVLNGAAQSLAPALLADLDPTDVVFVDPARRDPQAPRDTSLRARPERDPERWSPPWSWVRALRHPRVAVKAAPGLAPPDAWSAEWVGVAGTVVECFLRSWPADAARTAAVRTGSGWAAIAADPGQAPVRPVSGWLHEPDPAVVAAGAVDAAALLLGLGRISPDSAWLTSDAPAPGGLVRSFAVLEVLSGGPKEQRRTLQRHGVTGLTVKSREARMSPAAVLADLDRPEGAGHVLVVARSSGRALRVLCAPPARPAP
jgi:hypothetical protein